MRLPFLTFSVTWTGMRISLDLSAIARVMACLIHSMRTSRIGSRARTRTFDSFPSADVAFLESDP